MSQVCRRRLWYWDIYSKVKFRRHIQIHTYFLHSTYSQSPLTYKYKLNRKAMSTQSGKSGPHNPAHYVQGLQAPKGLLHVVPAKRSPPKRVAPRPPQLRRFVGSVLIAQRRSGTWSSPSNRRQGSEVNAMAGTKTLAIGALRSIRSVNESELSRHTDGARSRCRSDWVVDLSCVGSVEI